MQNTQNWPRSSLIATLALMPAARSSSMRYNPVVLDTQALSRVLHQAI